MNRTRLGLLLLLLLALAASLPAAAPSPRRPRRTEPLRVRLTRAATEPAGLRRVRVRVDARKDMAWVKLALHLTEELEPVGEVPGYEGPLLEGLGLEWEVLVRVRTADHDLPVGLSLSAEYRHPLPDSALRTKLRFLALPATP